MARTVAIYTVIHQPRRLKLPAALIPPASSKAALVASMEEVLFDEAANQRYLAKVAEKCYRPALSMFAELADAGLAFNVGASFSWLRQLELWDPALREQFAAFVARDRVELIGVEPYHSFLFFLDIVAFVERMVWMREECQRQFGKTVRVTDTTEMHMSHEVYAALRRAGFDAAVMDGRPWVYQWRQTSHLCHPSGAADSYVKLIPRHFKLSDDVGYRFSNKTWEGYPLLASTYADWILEATGDFVMLGWDFETFGEHHWADTGIFDFMRALPAELERCGIEVVTLSELVARYRDQAFDLPLPTFGSTWAGSGGMEFFLGNAVQHSIFLLMHHAYSLAKLIGEPEFIDLAMWLAQSDNLHLLQWWGTDGGSEAEVSAYFTPQEWWAVGAQEIPVEIQRVYTNFVQALTAYAPSPPPRLRAHTEAVHETSRLVRAENSLEE